MRTIVQNFPCVTGYVNALRNLGHEAHPWDDQYKPAFDLFSEFRPEIVICRSDLSHNLVKCIAKYKPVVYCFLHRMLNQDVVPYVHSFFTDNHTLNLSIDKRLVYLPPAFDSIRYKPEQPFGVTTYVGDFRTDLDWVLHAVNDVPLRIFGAGWPIRSAGRFLDKTEAQALSGPTLVFEGLEKAFKTIGCGGTPLMKKTPELELVFSDNLFDSYDDMIKLIEKPHKIKFDISKHTYIERVKELL